MTLPLFDGVTATAADTPRLNTLLHRVARVLQMHPGQWYTLEEIAKEVGNTSTASVSARIRDLRKHKFGQWNVESRPCACALRGTWEYRIVV